MMGIDMLANSRLNRNISRVFFACILITFLSGLRLTPVYGQLKIGDKLPQERFEEVKNTYSKYFPASSEPVRLYILDFWSKWCGSCIVSFPKVEGLQYRFKEDIKILAINPWNDDQEVRELFKRNHELSVKSEKIIRRKDGSWKGSEFKPRTTTLPALNGDKSWLDLFEIIGVPHHIWINSEGKVIAVTSPYDVNANNIEYYLRTGVLPQIALKPYPESYKLYQHSLKEVWGARAFSYHQNDLMIRDFYSGDGGSVFGYKYLGAVDSVKNTIRYSFVNTTIADLYKAAWAIADKEHYRVGYQYGRPLVANGDTLRHPDVLNERLIWEVSVPEYFTGPVSENYASSEAPGFNDWSFRAKFCAELELPLERKHEASGLLLEGLNTYFEQKFGISARIETRKRNCLVLKMPPNFKQTVEDSENISQEFNAERNVEIYSNHPFNSVFLDYLPYRIDHNDRKQYWITNGWGRHYMPRLTRNLPLLDETGLTGNLDIELNIVPDHIRDPMEALNIRLRGTGLYFKKEVRDIEMLIISDRPDSQSTTP